MRALTLFALFLSALITVNSALAEVFMHTDENGKVSFSDHPTPTTEGQVVEKIDIQETNTAPAIEARPVTPRLDPKDALDYKVRITSPTNGASITTGQRDLTLSVSVSPSLEQGFKLIALANGTRFGSQKAQGNSITLYNIYPGEQSIQVQLLDNSGKVVANSASISVNVHRAQAPRKAPRAP